MIYHVKFKYSPVEEIISVDVEGESISDGCIQVYMYGWTSSSNLKEKEILFTIREVDKFIKTCRYCADYKSMVVSAIRNHKLESIL
jgi:hypothetical protein